MPKVKARDSAFSAAYDGHPRYNDGESGLTHVGCLLLLEAC